MRFFVLSMLLLFIGINLHAQTNQPTASQSVEFLPSGTIFEPLTAHQQDPNVGVRKEIGSSRLKLDIGSTLDFLQVKLNRDSTDLLRVGSELLTYALSTNAQGLRLQIDALDGFFGGHIVYRHVAPSYSASVRLRLMHISAHLIDGHYDMQTMSWMDNRLPIPFTRDFGELTFALRLPLGPFSARFYSGLDYAAHLRPEEIQRFSSLHGFDATSGSLLGNVFGKPFEAYLAFNLNLTGIPTYVGSSVTEAGVKFGQWDGPGIKFFVNYATGMEFFSEYYNVRRNKAGLGFSFDFW